VRAFSGLNLLGFVLANVLLVLPGAAAYTWVCASLAVSHYMAWPGTARIWALALSHKNA
jgi:ABC-type Mn2+/Zn2+ transport system permease subunit